MINYTFKRENILVTFYTVLLSLLICTFSLKYLFLEKSLYNFFNFILLFIIFFNSWLLEVVHLNRYGKGSFLNYFFLTLQIIIILNLLIRNPLDIKRILATLVLLAVTLSVQHITE